MGMMFWSRELLDKVVGQSGGVNGLAINLIRIAGWWDEDLRVKRERYPS